MEITIDSLKRVLARFSYDHTGAFIDNRGFLLQKVDEYWENREFKYDRVAFREKNEYNQGMFTWNQAYINLEDISNPGNVADRLHNTFSQEVWKKIGVDSFNEARFDIYLVEKANTSFEGLFEQLKTLLNIDKDSFDIIKTPFTDIGFSMDFEESNNKMTLIFGPMEKEQMIGQYFKSEKTLPEVGLFCKSTYIINYSKDTKVKKPYNEALTWVEEKVIPFLNNILRKGRG